jgi:hypothetical protein
MGRQHWFLNVNKVWHRSYFGWINNNFLLFKNDLNLSAWKFLWITRPENVFCNLPPFWFSNRHINERDVIIWDVHIAIISRNILRKFLGWQSFMCHACQVKLQNVTRISYQDLSGNKFTIVFLAISRISAGVHERLSSIFVFYDRIWIKQKATLKTWSNFYF